MKAKEAEPKPAKKCSCGKPGIVYLGGVCHECHWNKYIQKRDNALANGTHSLKASTQICVRCHQDKVPYQGITGTRDFLCEECFKLMGVK